MERSKNCLLHKLIVWWQVLFLLFVVAPTAAFAQFKDKSPLVQDLEAIFYNPSFAAVPARTFSVADYGAKGEGETLNTKAIQATLNAASKAGGGVVTFPPGTYVTGAIFIRSNTELRIGKRVVIQAIQDGSHYPRLPTRIAGIEMDWPAALINVYGEENVRNTGPGPSGAGPSSDGVNTDSSSNILVENCDIDCNDDNLCLKSGKDADGLRVGRPAERIVYRDCITRSGHGLFTLGSETSGGMRDIEVYNLVAKGTSTGIRFRSAKVRGGLIENIRFHNNQMEDKLSLL
jgi:polygalacturonase